MNILTDLVEAVTVVPLVNPINITLSGLYSGAMKDLKPATTRFQEFIVFQIGTVVDGNHDFQLKESNDQLTNYTDIPNCLVSFSSANSNTNLILPFYRTKRYLRITGSSANVTIGGYFAAVCFAQRHRPGGNALVP